ncbi:putative zinc finger protein [Trypanosoma equiperdum]|uniref:Predicted zinc finger protein n=1 Tax=Trypanosoma equiperdum TaxID=5694 RepID=A0A1G4IIC0_TRYEQ|nr:predicted zinc finger protein [Trypanosoma equiperdum]
MIGNGRGLELREEYDMMLQLVRAHMLRRDQGVQPIVLQVQQEGAENREQVTLVFGQVEAEAGSTPLSAVATEQMPPASQDPLITELGPLLLQALALQLLISEQQRRVAAPLDQEAVEKLRRVTLDRDTLDRLETSGQTVCSICQESFPLQSEVYCLPCGHVFDVTCMQHWLERTRTCPNCRFTLQDVEQQYKDAAQPTWWESRLVDGEVGETKGDWTLCPSHSLSGVAEERNERLPSATPRRHQQITQSVGVPVDCTMQRHQERPQQLGREEEEQTQQMQLSSSGAAVGVAQGISGGGGDGTGTETSRTVSSPNRTVDGGRRRCETLSPSTSNVSITHEAVDASSHSLSPVSADVTNRNSRDCPVEVANESSERSDQLRRGNRYTPMAGTTFLPPPVALNRSVSPPVSSTSTRIAHYVAEEGLPTRVPEIVAVTRPTVRSGSLSLTNDSANPQSRSTFLQPIMPASGNARHAIRALRSRRNEREEGNSLSLTESGILTPPEAVAGGHGRMGGNNRSRRNVHLPHPPHENSSQRRLAESPQSRARDGDTRGEERRQNVVPLQPSVRGNQRKLAQYQSIIRGQSRRC